MCPGIAPAPDQCVASSMGKEIGGEMADIFRRTTIQDLCKKAEAMDSERQFDTRFRYYI